MTDVGVTDMTDMDMADMTDMTDVADICAKIHGKERTEKWKHISLK